MSPMSTAAEHVDTKCNLYLLTMLLKSNAVRFVCVLKGCWCLIEKLSRKCVCKATHLFFSFVANCVSLVAQWIKEKQVKTKHSYKTMMITTNKLDIGHLYSILVILFPLF